MSTAGTMARGAAITSTVLPPGWAHRDVSSQTAMSTKQSLNSSDGCTDTGPTNSQRRAPETVRPSRNTATSAPSPTT